jgi:hypothetical protein
MTTKLRSRVDNAMVLRGFAPRNARSLSGLRDGPGTALRRITGSPRQRLDPKLPAASAVTGVRIPVLIIGPDFSAQACVSSVSDIEFGRTVTYRTARWAEN